MYFGTQQQDRGWISTILVPGAIVAAIVLSISLTKVMGRTSDEPIIVYKNYWSGEVVSPEELHGASWEVTGIKAAFDLRDPNESEKIYVEVNRFKRTPDETTLYIDGWGYDIVEFGYQIDEGNLY